MKTLALKILDTLLAAAQRVAEGLAKVEVTTGPAVQPLAGPIKDPYADGVDRSLKFGTPEYYMIDRR